MAKKKKNTESLLTRFFAKKKKTRKKKPSASWLHALKIVLAVMFVTVLFAGGAIGMVYLDRHIKTLAAQQKPDGSLKLIDPPTWLNQQWQDTLVKTAGGMRFPLNEHSAKLAAERLSRLSWLENVNVQVTPEYLLVKADYRRPVGMIKAARGRMVYLDSKMRVLDYLPLAAIPIPEIQGLASLQIPEPGLVWKAEDAQAAVELLDLFNKMDLYFLDSSKIQKPLVSDIESVDVSNFAARRSRSAPNIVLNIKDGTKVYWGAAWGKAAEFVEADDKVKLARLYETFVGYNHTLQVNDKVKFIDLTWLEDAPRPR
jgi:hypothetical protein